MAHVQVYRSESATHQLFAAVDEAVQGLIDDGQRGGHATLAGV